MKVYVIEIPETSILSCGLNLSPKLARNRPSLFPHIRRLQLEFSNAFVVQMSDGLFSVREIDTNDR